MKTKPLHLINSLSIKLCLVFTLCIRFDITAQTFAPVGAGWYYSASANGLAPSGSEYYFFYSQGDTVIDGKTCSRVNITYSSFFNGIQHLSPEYFMTVGKKVYYYRYNRFNLLYDFDADAGDTLRITDPAVHPLNYDTISLIRIDSVITEPVGDTNLRVFYTTALDIFGVSYRGPVVENIGSVDWLLPRDELLPPEANGPIRCYSDTSMTYHPFDKACDYRQYLGEEPEDISLVEWNIYNQGISLDPLVYGEIEVSLTDVSGRILYRENISGPVKIPLDFSKPQLLLLSVRKENTLSVFKIFH